MRVKIIIEYDGTNYAGWQRQDNAIAVQQKIEEAVFEITGQRAVVTGAGRTDAGVHALGQVAHFDTTATIPPEKWAYALNTKLPEDIRIRSSMKVDPEFHSTLHAEKKHYRYSIYNAPHTSPTRRLYAASVFYPLDEKLMQAAADVFPGEHDFSAFAAAGSDIKTTVRRVYSAKVTRNGDMLYFDVVGNGFLYNMVRIMAGTIIEVGYGKLAKTDVENALRSGERSNAGYTAPACGLTMVEVYY